MRNFLDVFARLQVMSIYPLIKNRARIKICHFLRKKSMVASYNLQIGVRTISIAWMTIDLYVSLLVKKHER